MKIRTALERIESLSKEELIHFVYLADIEIASHHKCTENYDEAKMKKFGTPFLNGLHENKKRFEDRLREIDEV